MDAADHSLIGARKHSFQPLKSRRHHLVSLCRLSVQNPTQLGNPTTAQARNATMTSHYAATETQVTGLASVPPNSPVKTAPKRRVSIELLIQRLTDRTKLGQLAVQRVHRRRRVFGTSPGNRRPPPPTPLSLSW